MPHAFALPLLLVLALTVPGAASPGLSSGSSSGSSVGLAPASSPGTSPGTVAAAVASWRWPVDPPHPVVRPYIAPATPYAAGHRGIDIGAAGTTVYAPTAGVVHFVGVVVDRPVLSIRHPGGLISSYEPVQSTLTAGQAVARGEVVGTVLPGHCASICLHFGARLDGEYVSPLAYLEGIPRAVLLPTRW